MQLIVRLGAIPLSRSTSDFGRLPPEELGTTGIDPK
jgi:hypothetical protein